MPAIAIVAKEIRQGEKRVAITPNSINHLTKLGLTCKIQSGAGSGIDAADSSYNATIIPDLQTKGDIYLKVLPPTVEEVESMQNNAILIAFLYPHLNLDATKKLLAKNITSFAMELIPRISRAQDMDALSSQATIIGYKAVIIAANNSKIFFPMLITAAGSIRPAKVFVIGVGVAGLQAIATAKRLGAQVSAYDVRPETKEQTQSLGAKFLDTKVQAIGAGGYARELTNEEKAQQTQALIKHIAKCDVVITTAGVPGKTAPKVLTAEMVAAMQPGSIVVDAMAEMGGNCELTKPDATIITTNNVTILGPINLPSSLAVNASEMYAHNCINFLSHIVQNGIININWDDEIISSSVVTHAGQIKVEVKL